jgi:8-oxo-dGTP pyrophosphatase MutT (NUDIX family)
VAGPNDDEHWWDPEATPAATVVVLRDRDALEVLVLRRDDSLGFAGGAWVFPGGRIDPEDHAACADGDLEQAARRAAVREAAEEAGLALDEDRLHRWSHWTPPSRAGRRFTTAFFCTAFDGDQAGRDAAVKVSKLFVENGLRAPKVVSIPDGQDVTDFFKDFRNRADRPKELTE